MMLAETVIDQQQQIETLQDKVDLMVEIILRSIKTGERNEETKTNGR